MHWDFALILFVLLVLTGVIWFYDRFFHARKRRRKGEQAVAALPAVGSISATERAKLEKQTYDRARSEEHTSELQSRGQLVCRLLLEKKMHTQAGIHSRSILGQ